LISACVLSTALAHVGVLHQHALCSFKSHHFFFAESPPRDCASIVLLYFSIPYLFTFWSFHYPHFRYNAKSPRPTQASRLCSLTIQYSSFPPTISFHKHPKQKIQKIRLLFNKTASTVLQESCIMKNKAIFLRPIFKPYDFS